MMIENITQEPLIASKGMIYTNGVIYGSKIFLADGLKSEDFYEITKEEYQQILDEQTAENYEIN